MPLTWRGRAPANVSISVGGDDDRTRAVLISVLGAPTRGDRSCIDAATPAPDRVGRATVSASGGRGGLCFMRPTTEAPTPKDPTARAIAKPAIRIPVTLRFGARLFDRKPVRVRVTSDNASVSRAAFDAPVGATSEAFEVRSSTPEPFTTIGVVVELERRDLRLATTYTETHDLRFLLTPDAALGVRDTRFTCAQIRAVEQEVARLRAFQPDLARPVPIGDPDPIRPFSYAELADPATRLSMAPALTMPLASQPKASLLTTKTTFEAPIVQVLPIAPIAPPLDVDPKLGGKK